MSLATSKQNYNKAYKLYDKINRAWSKIESGGSEKNPEYEIAQILLDLKSFRKYLNGVYIDDLKGKIPQDTLEQVKHNMALFNEAHYYIERNIKGIRYADALKTAVTNFFDASFIAPGEYRKYAVDKEQLAKKFIATITNVDNVNDYENEIRRMMKGKMSDREFLKIFNTLKNEMIPLREDFESLEDFLKNNLKESRHEFRFRQ